MKASPRFRSSVLLALALVPLAMAGCGRVPGQFEILNNQIPPTTGACVIPLMPTQYRGDGVLDVSIVGDSFSTAYDLFPLIENNLPASSMQTDANQIQLTGFDVDITVLSAQTAAMTVLNGADSGVLHYRVPWSGGVSSGGGQISAVVGAFPVALARQLASAGGLGKSPDVTVNLRLQAVGTTNSGRSMTSDPFNFPLRICNGCLVGNVMPCPYTAMPANPGNVCNPAQDQVVDCCTDKGNLICPPPVAATP